MSPRPSVTGSKPFSDERESAARDDWDDVFGGGTKSKPNFVGASSPIPGMETAATGSKSDFLRQIDLMNVDQNQVREHSSCGLFVTP